MPNCTACGNDLEFDDTVDQYADDGVVIFYEIGHCPNCGKKFKWRDWYEFSHFQDLEEREG